MNAPIKLTEFSPGSGCGCKLSPKDLAAIVHGTQTFAAAPDARLLVGNDSNDDAAVYDIGNGQALISTTDFFTPIVNDPFLFGQIASVNAISDVYAMGGQPLVAIGILGWPVKKLPIEVAQKVLEGARSVCAQVGIALAGGHSIDISEPIFGLAVTGQVAIEHLKRNNSAQAGCQLFLTKPLGVGILTTAEKRGILKPEHASAAVDSMTRLNTLGMALGKLPGVTAMTDVTGFGLLGHLVEMCEGSGVNGVVRRHAVPLIEGLDYYLDQGSTPGGTKRNWQSYGHKVSSISERDQMVLCDPQTSGGLLVAVTEEGMAAFQQVSAAAGLSLHPLGELTAREGFSPDHPYVTVV
ncbi:selenophosphate synthase [Magnetococcus marinus MC-1]|uniref:Selenide, water dikinase n=1 Tax=Magnetococcus marinus (strain ATCC BAA-1437 / JCM 17883 / MC-1) TaxID=156889 RepID=A0LA92_MAGMM|nr:selenide, water dikinase SelD [Magnetococcus marinus]ABK44885.1 selenophosphate synthase [Magnetococcus marinus MC-1]